MRTCKAYTLVEILIVMGIVLILSGIVITVINPRGQRDRAKDTAIKKSVNDIAAAIEVFKASTGRYPSNSDVSYLQPYVGSSFTVYLSGSLLGFYSPSIENGTSSNSIFWDPNSTCLQSTLNETTAGTVYWTPSTKVQTGATGCSASIASASASSSAPPTIVAGSSGNPVAPVSNEFNQASSNPNALVAYYKMDETSGTVMADSSGKNNNGTYENGVTFDLGVKDGAMRLNGVNQYAKVPNLLGNPRSVTLSAWVNIDSMPASQGSEVVSIGDNIAMRVLPNKLHFFYHNSTTWVYLESTAPEALIVGKGWTNLVFVFDDNNNSQKMYVNGVELTSNSNTESIVYAGLGTITSIGNHANPTTMNWWFDGRIDEVKVWNYARSASQITADYNSSKLANLTNPYIYYKFNEGTGTVAASTPSSGGNATLVNMASPATATSGWTSTTAGKFDRAVSFDGTNDYVLSATPTTSSTSSLSYSMWIYVNSYTNGAAGDGSGTYFIDRTTATVGILSLKAVGSRWCWQIRYNNNTGITCVVGGTIQTGQWVHLALVRDVAGSKFVMYTNGVAGGARVDTKGALTPPTPKIGIHQGNSAASAFNGKIDDFRIFNYALTSDQVNADYRR